jgi:protein SCO1
MTPVVTTRHRFNLHAAFLLVLASSWAVLGGCRGSRKRYPLKGQLLTKNVSANQITLDNEEIPGFMPAMTMIYPVKDAQGFEQVQPGDRITAVVEVENGGSNYWLEHIAITDQSGRRFFSGAKKSREILPNQTVPDVPLVNQDGKTLHLSDFKGKAVLLTFIYTRCPFPNFCPLLSSKFAAIHDALTQIPLADQKAHLLSVSLDPSYDTAPVLRKYGLAYLKDDASGFANWDFASTSPQDLRTLASAFGLQYFEQNNQITHTVSTILVASDGTINQIWSDNEWKTSEVLTALKNAASLTN